MMGVSCEIVCATYELSGISLGVELTADARGLTECRLYSSRCSSPVHTSNQYLIKAMDSLAGYFAGRDQSLDCTLAPDGTPFQMAVWQAACEIPAGEVRSYSWIAQKIQNPSAVRAVARALSANPLLLFVPCHRVLRSNGTLGGFACGTRLKEQLLGLEGFTLPSGRVGLTAV